VLVTVFSPDTRAHAMRLVGALRQGDVKAELFMQDAKLGKQIGYADKKGIPIVAILGPDEVARGEVKFKRLSDQHEVVAPLSIAAKTVTALMTD